MYIYRALRKAQTITYFSNKKKLVINAIPLRTTLFLIHSEILRLTVQHTNNVNVHPCVFSSFSGHLHVCHHSCLTCTVSCCSADVSLSPALLRNISLVFSRPSKPVSVMSGYKHLFISTLLDRIPSRAVGFPIILILSFYSILIISN